MVNVNDATDLDIDADGEGFYFPIRKEYAPVKQEKLPSICQWKKHVKLGWDAEIGSDSKPVSFTCMQQF